MALKTFVKISQVNNLSDARYCAGMGAGILGFNLEPGTVHYIEPEKFRGISEWVAGVAFAAEFTEASPETIKRLLPEYPVDYLQTDRPDYLKELQQLSLPLILRVQLSDNSQPEQIDQLMQKHVEEVEFFLLEAAANEDIAAKQLADIFRLSERYPIVAGLGIEAESINQLLETYPFKGIALKGGEEIRAGYKTFDDMADILENLEVDEAY